MKKILISVALGSVMACSAVAATAETKVDVSRDGIFTALTSSRNLQATVDRLIAAGADHRDVVAIAGAAGIPQAKVQSLQVCVNSVSADSRVLGATCMRPSTVMTAYASGTNDPLSYLPSTAAGKRQDKPKK